MKKLDKFKLWFNENAFKLFKPKYIIDPKTAKCFIEIITQLNNFKNTTIAVLIHHDNQHQEFYNKLEYFLEIEKFKPYKMKLPIGGNTRRMAFANNTNQVKIWTLKSIQRCHPKDLVSSEFDWNKPLITYLERMPYAFYEENITIGNCAEILSKYKQFIKI